MNLTIGKMTEQIRENNVAKGWRSALVGPGDNTLGDYIALLHTEGAEGTEAYRDWKLADGTKPYDSMDSDTDVVTPAKPEGVGSELADLLIRLLDTGDVFGFTVYEHDFELGDVADIDPAVCDPELPDLVTFGDHMAWIHRRIDRIWTDTEVAPPWALRALVTVARRFEVDLGFEYDRKMTYNRTRTFRHGGRALSNTNA